MEYTSQVETVAATHRPYRWGKFQSWLLIIVGSMLIGAALAYSAPVGSVAYRLGRAFFAGYDKEISYLFESGNRTAALGMVMGRLVWFLGAGIGLLKKRGFGLLVFLVLTIRAVLTLSPIALAFTVGSLPYYYKRRREFRLP
jgi:hypothetical protein